MASARISLRSSGAVSAALKYPRNVPIYIRTNKTTNVNRLLSTNANQSLISMQVDARSKTVYDITATEEGIRSYGELWKPETVSALHLSSIRSAPLRNLAGTKRQFSTGVVTRKGLSPESEDPKPREPEEPAVTTYAADISEDQYHYQSDGYIDALVEQLEEMAEENEKIDVEYSAGVLKLVYPPNDGTYVINKQPPNKQIWLSSPLSGPKRYDYVIKSEGQDAKEGTGSGAWVYLRDGTTLDELLKSEIGVDMSDFWLGLRIEDK